MKNLTVLLMALIFSFGVCAQETTIAEQNKAAVRQYINAMNQKDWVNQVAFFFPAEGYEAFKKIHSEFREVFPDYHFNLETILAEGDKVCIYGTVTGTHTKTWNLFPAIPATGLKLSWQEMWVLTIAKGKAVDGQMINDRMSILNQMGYGCKPEAFKK